MKGQTGAMSAREACFRAAGVNRAGVRNRPPDSSYSSQVKRFTGMMEFMRIRALLLQFVIAASTVAFAQVQPNPVPGLPGIGLEEGLDTAGDLASITVFKDGKQIQTLPVCTEHAVSRKSPLGSINVADMNFDNYPDLLLEVSNKDDNATYCVWLWQPTSQQFVASPALSQIVNPQPDADKRTITSIANQDCQGACHDQKTYTWSDGELKLVKEVSQTLAPGAVLNGPGCVYVLSVLEEKNGKMTLVSSDRVNSDGEKVCTQ
jgi:hypothetical protein